MSNPARCSHSRYVAASAWLQNIVAPLPSQSGLIPSPAEWPVITTNHPPGTSQRRTLSSTPRCSWTGTWIKA
jgi:hypothetical protein